jgi:hypothetical protein
MKTTEVPEILEQLPGYCSDETDLLNFKTDIQTINYLVIKMLHQRIFVFHSQLSFCTRRVSWVSQLGPIACGPTGPTKPNGR